VQRLPRAPVTSSTVISTSIGEIGLSFSVHGLSRVHLPERGDLRRRLAMQGAELFDPTDRASLASGAATATAWIDRITAHLAGEDVTFDDLPLDDRALTPFQRKVYASARKIPRGTTASYADLAARVGVRSSRAIGGAMGKNPHPIVTPCHRVVGTHDCGGFTALGGNSTKATLLAIEGGGLGDPEHRLARRHLMKVDPALAPYVKRGACTLPVKPKGALFRTIVRAIAGQQLSTKAAATIFGRLEAELGQEPGSSWSAEVPQRLHETSHEALRAVGLSNAKAKSVHDLARRVLSGELPIERLPRMPDDQVVEVLCSVKGIGRWTAEMLLIFDLGRPDVLPVDDLGIRKGAQKVFGTRALPSPAAIIKRAESWRPWRSIGSWYLWRSLEA
jgi:O-6-methylguanine DNA methyltransferase